MVSEVFSSFTKLLLLLHYQPKKPIYCFRVYLLELNNKDQKELIVLKLIVSTSSESSLVFIDQYVRNRIRNVFIFGIFAHFSIYKNKLRIQKLPKLNHLLLVLFKEIKHIRMFFEQFVKRNTQNIWKYAMFKYIQLIQLRFFGFHHIVHLLLKQL